MADLNQTNVIAVTFDDDDKPYAALARLKQLDSEGRIELCSAAVVTRDASGRVSTKEAAGGEEMVGTATGGLIGLLVGVLGGPLGVLIGGATGLMIGSLFDLEEAEDTDSVLAALSQSVRPGHDTLLAELRESSDHGVVDEVMTTRSGAVLRRGVRDVEAEIAAAEEVQRKVRKKARERLREERHEKQKAEVEAKVAELKAKLPQHHGDPAEHGTDSALHAGSPS
jgi:uncharacterized membrane protein